MKGYVIYKIKSGRFNGYSYLYVSFGKKRFLLDTGCTKTLLFKEYKDRVVKHSKTSITAISGKTKLKSWDISPIHLDLSLNWEVKNVVYVDTEFLNISGIIGAAFFEQFQCVIDFPKKLVYVRNIM